MGCKRYSAASRHEVLLDEDEFRSFLQSLELGDVLLPFTTACDSPGTLKSILCSSFWSTMTGLPVPVWSRSTCLGVKTQRFVDSCPDTGSPHLLGLWLQHVSLDSECRDQTWYVPRFPLSLHLRVSPYLIIGYWVLVRFVGCRCCFSQYQNPNRTSNYLCRKSSVVVEVTHTISRIWFLQIPSQQLSRYNKLGVYRKGWLHYILFDRIWILYVEQAVHRPNTPCLVVFSSFSACTMQDVVWSSQACTDLCVPCSEDSQP